MLFALLGLTIILSAFFSGSETSMMTLNRYRLRHLIKQGHRGAIKAGKLLQRPDRLIGLILLGNNLVNIIAATLSTLIGIRLLGDLGVALAPFILVIVFLIFAEVLPKTFAALRPEIIAFPAAYILSWLSVPFSPAVYLVNQISNRILAVFKINPKQDGKTELSSDELHTVVKEAGHLIPSTHQKMLLSVLELEHVCVDDIMIPRSEVISIDIQGDDLIKQIQKCQHARVPVYENKVDNIIGILHIRRVIRTLGNEQHSEGVRALLSEPYFIPKGMPLHTQLLNFQNQKVRLGLVIDEYGVTQGIVTLEDILEEIVGEFTTDLQNFSQTIKRQETGEYLIDGATTLRELRRQFKWEELPTDGPKTFNGLILEHLETMPVAGVSLRIDNYTIEIVQVADNAVKKAKVMQVSKTEITNSDVEAS